MIGFVYGAKKGKILNMFIDDLSLPQKDQFGTQEVNEVCKTLLFSLKLIIAPAGFWRPKPEEAP